MLHAVKYLIYWLIQGVWVFVTLLPVIILNGSANNPGNFNTLSAGLVWLVW